MIHHDKHQVELVEVDSEKVTLRVLNLDGNLLSEFFLAKMPEQSAEEVAQATYETIYGKVGV
jgi:hypothetical protein